MPHEPASPRMERHHLNELTRPVNSKQALRLLQTDGASTADVGGVEWGGGWDLENYTYFQWLFFFWGLLGMVDRGADLSRLSQYFDSYMCVGRRE